MANAFDEIFVSAGKLGVAFDCLGDAAVDFGTSLDHLRGQFLLTRDGDALIEQRKYLERLDMERLEASRDVPQSKDSEQW